MNEWAVRTISLASAAATLSFATAAPAQFNRLRLEPTNGRVGYHLSAGLWIDADDLPRGNSGGPASGSCKVMTGGYSYSGELPPGIKLAAAFGPVTFSGTPRQPGRWVGTLTYVVRCSAGPDQSLYQRTLPVHWQIEP